MSQVRLHPITRAPIQKLNPRLFGTDAFPMRQSDISTILPPFGCMRKWFLQVAEYNLGKMTREFRDPRTVNGSVLHSVLETVHKDRQFEKLAWIYMRQWRLEESRTDEPPIRWGAIDRRELIRSGYQMLKGYCACEDNQNAEVIAQEARFVCKVGKVTAVGTIDQIRREGDGIRLVDFKSGMIGSQFDLDHGFQLALYSTALLNGTFFIRESQEGEPLREREIRFGQWPNSLGLIKLTDYLPYEKPTPKTIKYVSEAAYYGARIGTEIRPLTAKNPDGNPKLRTGAPRGPGFYQSQMTPEHIYEFERSVQNIVATVKMNRYWWANHSMACSMCAFTRQCRGYSMESGRKLADLDFKPTNRRRSDGGIERSSAING